MSNLLSLKMTNGLPVDLDLVAINPRFTDNQA